MQLLNLCLFLMFQQFVRPSVKFFSRLTMAGMVTETQCCCYAAATAAAAAAAASAQQAESLWSRLYSSFIDPSKREH